jgi:hypothetical protein
MERYSPRVTEKDPVKIGWRKWVGKKRGKKALSCA